jgi:hemolysin activation/secretion protein
MEIERTLKLGEAGVLVGRGQAQWSDSPLLSSDQISAGGVNQVRGFDETVGYASKGIIGTLEMQSPGFLTPHCGEFKGITFIDGAFWDGDEFTQSGQVASVGVGLRWQLEEALSARLDLGIPFDYSDDVDGKPRLHFAISKTW